MNLYTYSLLFRMKYRNFINRCLVWKWKFQHWFFQWLVDGDGDLVLRIAGFINFIKYKESCLVQFHRKPYAAARKRLGDCG